MARRGGTMANLAKCQPQSWQKPINEPHCRGLGMEPNRWPSQATRQAESKTCWAIEKARLGRSGDGRD
jgi:hypothetical protein